MIKKYTLYGWINSSKPEIIDRSQFELYYGYRYIGFRLIKKLK